MRGTFTRKIKTKGFRTNKIDSVKNLSYESKFAGRKLHDYFEATATANGYAATAEMKLSVSTTFSQGFYILKETADGNTELDVYTQNGLVSDLLASTQGEALSGSPRNLSVGYSQAFYRHRGEQNGERQYRLYHHGTESTYLPSHRGHAESV